MQINSSDARSGGLVQVIACFHFGEYHPGEILQKADEIHLHIDLNTVTDQSLKSYLRTFRTWFKREFPTAKSRRKVCWQWWVDDQLIQQKQPSQAKPSQTLIRKLVKKVSTTIPQSASWNLYPPLASWSEWQKMWMSSNTNTLDVLDHLRREGEILHRRETQANKYQKLQADLLPGVCQGNTVSSLFYRRRRHKIFLLLLASLFIPLGVYAAVNIHQMAEEYTQSRQNTWRQAFPETRSGDPQELAEIRNVQEQQIVLLGQSESIQNSCEILEDLRSWALHYLWIQQRAQISQWQAGGDPLNPVQFSRYKDITENALSIYEELSAESLRSLWQESNDFYAGASNSQSEKDWGSLHQANCDTLIPDAVPYTPKQWQDVYEEGLKVIYLNRLELVPDSTDKKEVPFESGYALPAILAGEEKARWESAGLWVCPQNYPKCNAKRVWDSLQTVILADYRNSLQVRDWSVTQWQQWWEGWGKPTRLSGYMDEIRWYFAEQERLQIPALYQETIKPLLLASGEHRQTLLMQLSFVENQSAQNHFTHRPPLKHLNLLIDALYEKMLHAELTNMQNQWQAIRENYTRDGFIKLHSMNQSLSHDLLHPHSGKLQRWIRKNPLINRSRIFGRDSLRVHKFLSQIQRGQHLREMLHQQTGTPVRLDIRLRCSLPHQKIQMFWQGDSLELLPEQSEVSATFTVQGGIASSWAMILRGETYRTMRLPAAWPDWQRWIEKRTSKKSGNDSGIMEVQLYLEGKARYTPVDIQLSPLDDFSGKFLQSDAFDWRYPHFPKLSNPILHRISNQTSNQTSNKEYSYDS